MQRATWSSKTYSWESWQLQGVALGEASWPVVETVLRVETRSKRRNRGRPGARRPLAVMSLHHPVGKASSKLL